jgi:hypothetical protein
MAIRTTFDGAQNDPDGQRQMLRKRKRISVSFIFSSKSFHPADTSSTRAAAVNCGKFPERFFFNRIAVSPLRISHFIYCIRKLYS